MGQEITVCKFVVIMPKFRDLIELSVRGGGEKEGRSGREG